MYKQKAKFTATLAVASDIACVKFNIAVHLKSQISTLTEKLPI